MNIVTERKQHKQLILDKTNRDMGDKRDIAIHKIYVAGVKSYEQKCEICFTSYKWHFTPFWGET